MALEQCTNLDKVFNVVEKHPIIGGHGTLWSNQKSGRGALVELTPEKHAIEELEDRKYSRRKRETFRPI